MSSAAVRAISICLPPNDTGKGPSTIRCLPDCSWLIPGLLCCAEAAYKDESKNSVQAKSRSNAGHGHQCELVRLCWMDMPLPGLARQHHPNPPQSMASRPWGVLCCKAHNQPCQPRQDTSTSRKKVLQKPELSQKHAVKSLALQQSSCRLCSSVGSLA